jgi:hypothetical protein
VREFRDALDFIASDMGGHDVRMLAWRT